MQKTRKVVYNFIILTLIVNNCYSQNNNDDYIILDKVINMNYNDTVFLLQKNSILRKEQLKKYYRHQVLNEKGVISIIGGKITEDGKILRDDFTQEYQDEFQRKWYSNYNPIDSIFSNNEIKELSISVDSIFWDEKQIRNKIQLIDLDSLVRESRKGDYKGIDYFQSHKISKPFYSTDKKYAIVQYRKYAKPPSYLYIFEKQKGNWVKIVTIKEHF